jgi:hypothetical protein
MANQQVINSFNAGELSPYLYARNDLSKYNSGCLTMENFQILPYGGAVRRPAIKYISTAKNNEKVRLISFEFSSSQAYVIELGNLYARFYKNGAQLTKTYSAWLTTTAYSIGDLVTNSSVHYRCLVAHTSGTFATDLSNGKWVATAGASDLAYEIPTPWTVSNVYGLKFTQSADVMWFVHPSYPVQKLSRFGDTSWTLVEQVPEYPALLDTNTTAITLTPSATTGSITLTASSNFFDANHVGAYFEIEHVRTNNVLSVLNATGAGPANPASSTTNVLSGRGDITFTTTGTWLSTDDIVVWRTIDGGTNWEKFRQYNLNGRNVDTLWEEEESSAIYAVTATAATGGFRLVVNEFYTKGLVKITGYTNTTTVSATVVQKLGNTTATKRWTEGAWSTYRGFPTAVTIWENRTWYAGTLNKPNTIWSSKINDFENFELGSLDTAAINLTIGSGLIDEIRWLLPQKTLVIGTVGSEWVLEAESDNKPVTPSSFALKRKTTYGSNNVQAVLVNSAGLFVMRQGRKVREFTYRFDVDDYVAPDLTILSEHITAGGITTAAYQQQPDNVYLAIRADGTMIPMTYERDQEVTGWYRWTVDGGNGDFESVCVLPKDNDEDEVWVSCAITVGNARKRFIGKFDKREWGSNIATEWAGQDFYVTATSPAGNISVSHLEGKSVAILRDGMVDPDQTVTSGVVTPSKAGTRFVVGLPYTSTMAPMYVEPQIQFIQPMGKHKGLFKAVLRFKDTINAKVGQTLDRLEQVIFRTTGDVMDAQVDLFSGEKKISFDNSYEFLHTCYVVQDKPLPITVIAMIPTVEVKG